MGYSLWIQRWDWRTLIMFIQTALLLRRDWNFIISLVDLWRDNTLETFLWDRKIIIVSTWSRDCSATYWDAWEVLRDGRGSQWGIKRWETWNMREMKDMKDMKEMRISSHTRSDVRSWRSNVRFLGSPDLEDQTSDLEDHMSNVRFLGSPDLEDQTSDF